MATQVISAATGSSTASTALNSTKVRVSTSSSAVYYAVGTAPVANASNCAIIPSNSVRFINMQGVNNAIAFMAIGTASTVSVEPIGTVNPDTITGSVYRPS